MFQELTAYVTDTTQPEPIEDHTEVEELDPNRFTALYCWECECVLRTAWDVVDGRCASCERHALDEHEPVRARRVYCHGAGPEGRRHERLNLQPRPLRWEETAASSF